MSTLNKMSATDLTHPAKMKFQPAALELVVESNFLLSGRQVLDINVFNDIFCRL